MATGSLRGQTRRIGRLLRPRLGAVYRGSWLVFAYIVLRYLAFERHPATYGDTPSYHTAQHASIFSEQFLAGYRSFTVPLLWKLLHTSESGITIAQLAFSIACWLFLAWTVASLVARTWARALAYVVVLGLSLTGPIVQWDRDLLSESATFSLLALLVAVSLRVVRRPTWPALTATLVVGLLWVFARDSDAYAAPVVAVALAVVLVHSRSRALPAAALAGTVAIFAASLISSGIGHRADNPVQYVVSTRMPQDRPSALTWMRAHGYTTAMAPNTTSVFRHYLVVHPWFTLTDVFESRPTYAPWPASDNRLTALYTPHVEKYEKSTAPWRLPHAVQVVFDPPQPLWLLLELVVVGLLVGVCVARRLANRLWLVPAALVLAVYPQLVVIWNVDGLEPDRHALGTAIELRIALVLLLVLAVSALVQRRPAPAAPRAPS